MRVLFVGGGTLGSVTPLLAVAGEFARSGGLALRTSSSHSHSRGAKGRIVQPAIRDTPPVLHRGDLKIAATFWGTNHGPERALVEAAGIPFRTIPSGKLRRYFDLRNIIDLFVIAWAFWVSLARLLRHRPSVVVGAGSFVQVPVMWAAWFLRIPIVLHQLDVRPCLANRLCAPIARAITVTFPESASAFGMRNGKTAAYAKRDGRPKLRTSVLQGKTTDTVLHGRAKLCQRHRKYVAVIGVPVRRVILEARTRDSRAAKRVFGFSGDRPVLLVLGGSTGAQALNELVTGALRELTAVADVVHVTGRGKLSRRHFDRSKSSSGVEKSHEANEISRLADSLEMTRAYRPFPLLTNQLPDALAAADLVVSRAGMGTIAELGALGKPTVLVPMPDSHQEENAAALAALCAVQVWHQRDLTPSVFAKRVRKLLADVDRCTALGATFYRAFPPDAVVRIATIIRTAVKD